MPDLPTGTVTFVFTDIEGSTGRWEQQPDVMRAALARHDAILREAITAHQGAVFKTMGDAFHAAFATAPQALTAALAAQRALAAEPGGEAGPMRVRMAVHTGAAEQRDGDYFGQPLNRAARLLAAAHGGQVLLSQPAFDLVRDALTDDIRLRDLGEHRLKDLARPERVFQVVAPDLPADFPPLRTLDTHPNNLPAQPSPLIGREHEVETVCGLLRREGVRLLTLTGPGGAGKTRLGLQAAADLVDQFTDGVFFVALAPITEPGMVAPAIAQTLAVRERGDRPLVENLKDELHDKHLLLLLDNFEQVAAAAPLVADLLAACPQVKVLVTSRALMHLRGEHDFPVPSLALPPAGNRQQVTGNRDGAGIAAELSQYAAVALFIERAQELRQDLIITNENAPAVAEICYRLDGLPLAIELAAARIRLLSPSAMLARLEQRLPLLTGGARDLPARQQTLRSAIAWSYDLLDSAEQVLFRRLAVFVGGCRLEAVETACNADGDLEVFDSIASLVDKSLLRQEEGPDGEPRFTMLETIREFGLEQLSAAGEADAIERRHADCFLALAEEAEPELGGPQQGRWVARLDEEHDNLRAVLRWCEARGEAMHAVRLVEVLHWFWLERGYATEGRTRVARLLRLDAATRRTEVRARLLAVAGNLAFHQGDPAAARPLYEEALAIRQELGEPDTQDVQDFHMALGIIAGKRGDYTTARTYMEEVLAIVRRRGDTAGIFPALNDLANLAHEQGDYAAARALFEESLSIAQQLGNRLAVALVLNNVAVVARDQGDLDAARALFEACLATQRELGDRRGIAFSLVNLANLMTGQGDYAGALRFLSESLAIHREMGSMPAVAYVLEQFAGVAAAQGQATRALRLAGAANALRAAVGVAASPAAQSLLEQRLAPARQSLGEAAAATAWAEGRAMSPEQAIDEALAGGGV